MNVVDKMILSRIVKDMYMITNDDINEIFVFSVSNGIQFLEFYFEDFECNFFTMNNSRVDSACHDERHGLRLRAQINGECHYFMTSDFTKETIINYLKNLPIKRDSTKNLVQFTMGTETQLYDKIKLQKYKKMNFLDKKNQIMHQSDLAFHYSNLIDNVSINYYDGIKKFRIVNSIGVNVSDFQFYSRISVTSSIKQNNQLVSASAHYYTRNILDTSKDLNLYNPGKIASMRCITKYSASKCPSGKMPVILCNGIGGILIHEACGHLLEADTIENYSSPFSGKIGQFVANQKLTVIDDPTIVNSWGGYKIDDEGYIPHKTVLIKNGILCNYLYDTKSANSLGKKLHYNARCESFRNQIKPRMSNTYIAAGDDSLDDMIKEIQYGLYVTNIDSGNVELDGNFNFSISEAFLIVNGRLSKPVTGATLIGNCSESLKRIDRIASDLKFESAMCTAASGTVPVTVGQPHIRINGLLVGGISHD